MAINIFKSISDLLDLKSKTDVLKELEKVNRKINLLNNLAILYTGLTLGGSLLLTLAIDGFIATIFGLIAGFGGLILFAALFYRVRNQSLWFNYWIKNIEGFYKELEESNTEKYQIVKKLLELFLKGEVSKMKYSRKMIYKLEDIEFALEPKLAQRIKILQPYGNKTFIGFTFDDIEDSFTNSEPNFMEQAFTKMEESGIQTNIRSELKSIFKPSNNTINLFFILNKYIPLNGEQFSDKLINYDKESFEQTGLVPQLGVQLTCEVNEMDEKKEKLIESLLESNLFSEKDKDLIGIKSGTKNNSTFDIAKTMVKTDTKDKENISTSLYV